MPEDTDAVFLSTSPRPGTEKKSFLLLTFSLWFIKIVDMKATNFPGKVPEVVVRTTAIQVTVIAVLTIAFASPWPVLLLMLDFATRAFISPKLSPLATVSRVVWVPALNLNGPEIFYTPKKFAARIGFAMTLVSAVLYFLGLPLAGGAVIAILALFSFLEGAFRFCVGCKIYAFLVGRGMFSGDDCADCVN